MCVCVYIHTYIHIKSWRQKPKLLLHSIFLTTIEAEKRENPCGEQSEWRKREKKVEGLVRWQICRGIVDTALFMRRIVAFYLLIGIKNGEDRRRKKRECTEKWQLASCRVVSTELSFAVVTT